MNKNQKAALDASYRFIKLMRQNMGVNDDWPINVVLDEEVVGDFCDGITGAYEALMKCGYRFPVSKVRIK